VCGPKSWPAILLLANFHQISTWKTWFRPVQRIFPGEKTWPKFARLWKQRFQDCQVIWEFLEGSQEYWRNLFSFRPLDWVCNRNLPKLFYWWSPFWLHHKILKGNPGPDSLSDGAHGVSAKKIMVWLSQASGILASWISQSFICHTYIIIAHPMHVFLTSFCLIVVLTSRRVPKALQKYWKLKCGNIRGAISWGLFHPLSMKEIELWSNIIWDSGPRLEIILEFWPQDWSIFGLRLEPFSSTVEGFYIWNLWSS
jgi:hypothetical protein